MKQQLYADTTVSTSGHIHYFNAKNKQSAIPRKIAFYQMNDKQAKQASKNWHKIAMPYIS